MISSPPRMEIQQSMRRNYSSFYHASATTLFANHGDFFNTHRRFHKSRFSIQNRAPSFPGSWAIPASAKISGKEHAQFSRQVHDHVWRSFTQRMRSETVSYAASPHTGVATGEYVIRRVANHQRLFWTRAGFLQDCLRSEWVRFFRRKAVAAVHRDEELA